MVEIVRAGAGKVRLSNEELKRRASKAIYEGDIIVFDSLPGLVAQIIENKVWESYNHNNFADFALDHTSNGLGVNTDARLWLLKCAMHVHGDHLEHWAEVLVKVEGMVRLMAKEEGRTIRSFNGNSLERLAKNGVSSDTRIKYLPSRNTSGDGIDGHLYRLRKNHPETYRRVLAGELTPRQGMLAARKADGERVNHDSRPLRVRSDFMLLSDSEKEEFIEWLRSEGHLRSGLAKRASSR